jgi:hypothetical protein
MKLSTRICKKECMVCWSIVLCMDCKLCDLDIIEKNETN